MPTVLSLQKSHPKVIKTPRRLLVRHKEEEIQEETKENEPTCPEENQIDSTNHCNNEASLEDQIIELGQQIAALESWNSKLECELRFGLKDSSLRMKICSIILERKTMHSLRLSIIFLMGV